MTAQDLRPLLDVAQDGNVVAVLVAMASLLPLYLGWRVSVWSARTGWAVAKWTGSTLASMFREGPFEPGAICAEILATIAAPGAKVEGPALLCPGLSVRNSRVLAAVPGQPLQDITSELTDRELTEVLAAAHARHAEITTGEKAAERELLVEELRRARLAQGGRSSGDKPLVRCFIDGKQVEGKA